MKNFLFALFAIFLNAGLLRADNELDVFNSTVESVKTDGQYLYVGGLFTRYSAPTGGWVGITNGEDSPGGTWPRVSGIVYKTISDGNGGYYVGGDFSGIGSNYSIKNLAHVLSDGSVDSSFSPNPNSLVIDMILDSGTLYVGGGFCNIASVSLCGLASFDTATGSLTSWRPSITGDNFAAFAFAIGTNGGTKRLYVGGSFTKAETVNHGNIAAYVLTDGANPTIDSNFIPSFPNSVKALWFDDSPSKVLFVGGTFSQFSFSSTTYTPRAGLARINSLNGSEGTAYNAQITGGNAAVYSLASDNNGHLFVGGSFTSIAGSARASAAELSTSSVTLQNWNPGVGGFVDALTYHYDSSASKGYVYLGGTFTSVKSSMQNYLAKFDLVGSGSLVSWDPGPFGFVEDILIEDDGNAFVGGSFAGMSSDTSIRYLAKVDLSNGHVVDTWKPSPDSHVNDLALHEDKLFVTGAFTNVNSQSSKYLVGLDKNTGNTLDSTEFNATLDATGVSLAVDDSKLYVGGYFSKVTHDGAEADHSGVVCLDANGGTVSSDFAPTAGGPVKKVYLDGDYVYLGGDFTDVNSTSRNHLARVKKTDGSLTAFNPDITGTTVNAILANDSRLFIGGNFTAVTGTSLSNLAVLDISDGTLDSSWSPDPGNEVTSLYTLGDRLYVGGAFRNIASQGSEHYIGLAAFKLSDLSFDSTFDANLDYGVHTLAGYQQKIWAGGDFIFIGENQSPYRALALVQSNFANLTAPSAPEGVLFPDNQLESNDTGTWDVLPPVAFSKSWLRCDTAGESCQAISSASGDFYSLTNSDLGYTIKVRVDATGQNGSGSADSAATGVIGGTPTPTPTPTITSSPVPTALPTIAPTLTATPSPTPDHTAPKVTAKKSSGKYRKTATIKFKVVEASGATSDSIKVSNGTKTALSKNNPMSAIPASGVKSVTVSAKKLSKKTYSFCVISKDASGNKSKKSCSSLVIK